MMMIGVTGTLRFLPVISGQGRNLLMNVPSSLARVSAPRIGTAPKLFICAAVTLAVPAVAAASPAAAAPAAASAAADTYSLSSGQVALAAGGHTWDLSVIFQSGETTSIPATLDVQISRAAGKGQLEDHIWVFSVPNSVLSFSGGDAKLDAGSSVSPLASVDVAFTHTSSKPMSCIAGSGTAYSGTLKGTVTIKTGFKQTGTLGGASLSFAAPNTLEAMSGCVPPAPCLASWTSPHGTVSALGDTIGGPGDEKTTTLVERSTTLSSTVTRVDGAVMSTPKPKLSGGTLHITTSSSGIITGSATLSGGTKEPTEKLPCVTPTGKSYTEHQTDYADPTFKSPAGIIAHTLLTGTLKSKKSGEGFFTVSTFTKG
jgi:hypothetical protein